jgi:hypothetical protein
VKHLATLLLQQDSTDSSTKEQIKAINESKIATRLLCHSAVYNVKYFQSIRTPSSAEATAASFAIATDPRSAGNTTRMEPVSIGSTPLDGIVSFLVGLSFP